MTARDTYLSKVIAETRGEGSRRAAAVTVIDWRIIDRATTKFLEALGVEVCGRCGSEDVTGQGLCGECYKDAWEPRRPGQMQRAISGAGRTAARYVLSELDVGATADGVDALGVEGAGALFFTELDEPSCELCGDGDLYEKKAQHLCYACYKAEWRRRKKIEAARTGGP